MSGLIDWELLAELHSSPAMSQPTMWDAFASRYDGYSKLQGFHTAAQIEFMQLRPHETLLDVGSGTGRISIPAAAVADKVTAIDTSPGMLDRLVTNAKVANLRNIAALHLPWEDVEPGINLAQHDVVIASRSPAMSDLHKLDALAKRAVYVMMFCGPSLKQFHDRLVDGIESFPSAGPRRSAIAGHALVFNRAVAMGKEAHVSYLENGFHKRYQSEDEAVADFAWLNLPAGSEARFRHNLRPFLQQDGANTLLHVRTRTAVIWWNKQAPVVDPI